MLVEDLSLATKLIFTNVLSMRTSMVQAQNCYLKGVHIMVKDPYMTRFPNGVVEVLVE